MSGYVMSSNAEQAEFDRLVALERCLDPHSQRVLTPALPGPDGRCLEVGGGAGSVARWLGERLGPDGQLTVVDVDCRFLRAAGIGPEVAVVEGDITTVALDVYELVHCRSVLVHLPERHRVLERLVEAVAPGGWLVVEEPAFVFDADLVASVSTDAATAGTLGHLMNQLFTAAGMDVVGFPLRLPLGLKALGLEDPVVETFVPWSAGGASEGWHAVAKATTAHLGPLAVQAGLADAALLERAWGLYEDPDAVILGPLMVSVRARRP